MKLYFLFSYFFYTKIRILKNVFLDIAISIFFNLNFSSFIVKIDHKKELNCVLVFKLFKTFLHDKIYFDWL